MINFIISVFFKEVYYVKTNTIFSLSDKGAFITGTDFMCDGGATASYYYGPLKPYIRHTGNILHIIAHKG